MTDKQHAEVMDALYTIGRNIAQQDAVRLRVAHALEALGTTANVFCLIAAILWIISISAAVAP